MKKIMKTLLFITLLMLLVGAVNASDISDTDSVSAEAVVKDTNAVSDIDAVPQDTEVELKESPEITNWSQLAKAVDDTKGQTWDITLNLGEGTYINTGTIIFNNPDAVITIEGNGQTINGNKNQVFNYFSFFLNLNIFLQN